MAIASGTYLDSVANRLGVALHYPAHDDYVGILNNVDRTTFFLRSNPIYSFLVLRIQFKFDRAYLKICICNSLAILIFARLPFPHEGK